MILATENGAKCADIVANGYPRLYFTLGDILSGSLHVWTFALLKKYLDSYVDCRDLTYGCYDFQKSQVDEFSDDEVNPLKR